MLSCLNCKRWKECPGGKAHYEYKDIRWCVFQISWLFIHSAKLIDGEWPDDPDKVETGYTGGNVKKPIGHEARFVKSALVIGELEARFKTVGKAGQKFLHIAVSGQLVLSDTEFELYEVLMYVKGFKRKLTPFSVWKAVRKYDNYKKKSIKA